MFFLKKRTTKIFYKIIIKYCLKIFTIFFIKQKKELQKPKGWGGRGKLGFPTNKHDYYIKVNLKMSLLNLQNQVQLFLEYFLFLLYFQDLEFFL